LKLNWSFGFGLRSLVVDVHAMTLPKGYGTVRLPAIGDEFGCHHHWEMGIGTGQHRED
jgi:hypothetical protein